MTSTVQYTIVLFIYIDRSRCIFGGSVVISFDDLKFLFFLFPFGLCTSSFLTSDFTNRDSWDFALLAVCVGVLCFRVTHEDV